MTGYYPCLQDDELVFSATAASVSMHIEDSLLRRERRRLLGSAEIGFGGIIPFHCRALQANVPAVVRLTDEVIITGSAYHLVAPVLLENERERLLKKLFDGIRTFGSGLPGESATYLQYCPECARDDIERGNRQCWRVLPNVPGNNTCVKHGSLLITTMAKFSNSSIPPNAADWIDLKAPYVKSTNKYDIQISRDLQWLYRMKSRECPGWKNLSAALTVVLSKHSKYRRSRHFLDVDAIRADLGKIAEITMRIAPRLLRRGTLARILYQREWASAPAFSLLSQLGGSDLKGLFKLASDPRIGKTQYPTFAVDRTRFRKTKGPARLAEAKVRLEKFITEHPDVSRMQLGRLCSGQARYAKRHDPVWFVKEMPWSMRGVKNQQEWAQRDHHYFNRLREQWKNKKSPARFTRFGVKTILRRAGLPSFLLINAQGRLPNTLQFVNDLVRRPDGTLPYRSGMRRRDSPRCM